MERGRSAALRAARRGKADADVRVEAEVIAFLAAHADQMDERGRRRLVRHGHAPKRVIQTGIGGIEVQRPRVRDRGADGASRIRFTSAVLPAYLRRARNIEELLPWLYLKGVSTGQFEDALAVLLGPNAPGLSAATIRRLVRSIGPLIPIDGRTSTGAGKGVI